MTHKKPNTLILAGLIIFLHTTIFAQQKLEDWDVKIDLLKNKGIDTLILYTPFEGNFYIRNTGDFHIMHSKYLIWHDKKGYHIQKFSNCLGGKYAERNFDTVFNAIPIEGEKVFQYLLANIGNIQKEQLKPALIRIKNGDIDTVYERKSSHISSTGVTIYTTKNEVSNYFDDDQLYDGISHNEDGSIREIRESINYNFNISTSIYKLTTLISALIKMLEDNHSFGHN